MRTQLMLLLCLLAAFSADAQTGRKYEISGVMTSDSLFTTTGTVRKLYLARVIDGRETLIDSVAVKKRRFKFKGIAPETVDVAFIKGFDNGFVQLFLEPGSITVAPFDARFPVGARVGGTPCNDVLGGYQQLCDSFTVKLRSGESPLMANVPKGLKPGEEAFLPYQRAAFFGNKLYLTADIIKYVSRYLDSPASLYIIRYSLFHLFSPKVVERQLLRAVHPTLREHPLYKEMENLLAAAKLAVGEQSPVFDGQTPSGDTVRLADLRGNYVLLDFWASWCGPCRREFPYLKQALSAAEGFGRFKVLSYSLDDDGGKWTASIASNALSHSDWIHISTLRGWSSDVVRLFNITAIPHTVLLNPDGKVIAFNFRGEELVAKIKGIANGTETYE